MVSIEDFGQYETAWCPGCGNFSILTCVKKALAGKGIAPHQVLFASGIGQAAKTPHYLNCNMFNGLHGRSLPVATGARLANPELTVIAESGDGCMYGEGGNHFLAALRRNVNITMLVHDNQIYGLTKGQASPTSGLGHVTKAQPHGVQLEPIHPLSVAIALQAGFVARGFTGMQDQLVELIQGAIDFPGFALVDILQQCVSFNHVNTFKWYKERCRPLEKDYDPSDWQAAMVRSQEWGDVIPTGILYTNRSRKPYEDVLSVSSHGPLYKQERSMEGVKAAMQVFA